MLGLGYVQPNPDESATSSKSKIVLRSWGWRTKPISKPCDFCPKSMAISKAIVFRWLLDVDKLWATPFQGDGPFKSTELWASGEGAQNALGLLPTEERTKVLRFYRHTDAKLCLGSCLLKRCAIAQTCDVPWTDVTISEDEHRKPCYKPADPAKKTLQFNVSHHGALVVLVGCTDERIRVGVDIVRMNWEKDYATVMRDGFEAWARVFETVFSNEEIRDITHYMPPAHTSQADEFRAKLRHFYVHWCLKEAYVKMTGEALLAKWLKQLEFRNVQVPLAGQEGNGADWGQTCRNVEIWFHGKMVEDVQLEIQAFRDDYMVATAVSRIDTALDAFRALDVEHDVYPSAR
ncbi:MAG: hypothetical protein Q9217_005213 [Psora testacea]